MDMCNPRVLITVFSPLCIIDVQDIDDDPVDPPLQSPVASSSSVDRKDTQRKVLMQLQSIFAHLIEGRLQFHTPQGFWRDFRLSGTCSLLVVYMHVVDQLTCMRRIALPSLSSLSPTTFSFSPSLFPAFCSPPSFLFSSPLPLLFPLSILSYIHVPVHVFISPLSFPYIFSL